MDKRILRERMRRKKRQLFIRKIIRLGACAVAVILVLVFLVKGIITPLVTKIGGGSSKTVEVQAQTQESGPGEAVRQPIRSQNDGGKAGVHTVLRQWNEGDRRLYILF